MHNFKRISAAMTLSLCLITNVSAAQVKKDIKIEINGENIVSDVSPFIEKDRTLVPIRVISENLGYEVGWDNKTRKVTVKNKDKTIELVVGKKDVKIDDKVSTIDVPPMIKSERTFVPLRFISESFDNDVDWNNDTRTVKIKKRVNKVASIFDYEKSSSIISESSIAKYGKEQDKNSNISNNWSRPQDSSMSLETRKTSVPQYRSGNNFDYTYKNIKKDGDYYAKKINNLFDKIIKDDKNYEIINNISRNVKVHPQLTEVNNYGGVKLSGSIKNNTNYIINFLCYELILDNGKIVLYTVDETVSPNNTGYIFSANHPVLYDMDTNYFHGYKTLSVMADVTLANGERRVAYDQDWDLMKKTLFNTDGYEKVSDYKRPDYDKINKNHNNANESESSKSDNILNDLSKNIKLYYYLIPANSPSGLDSYALVQNNSKYTIKEMSFELILDNGKPFYYVLDGHTFPQSKGMLLSSSNINKNLAGMTIDRMYNSKISEFYAVVILPNGEETSVGFMNEDAMNSWIFTE